MRQKKIYVITAAQACGKLHRNFWRGLRNYEKKNRTEEIIVLPLTGAETAEDWTDNNFPKELRPLLFRGKRYLNSNCSIRQFHIMPQMVDPLTGLDRFAQRGTTLIFASPKQRLRAVPHSQEKHPKFLMTTGVCTEPRYATSEDYSIERRRRGSIAKRDHTYGAIVVEVVDNKLFHVRHLWANARGQFCDLGTIYDGRKTRQAKAEAMVLADWHNGQGDPLAIKASLQQIRVFKPKRLFLHDFFDGHSISHHIEKKPVREKLLQIYDKDMWRLDDELKDAAKQLLELASMAPEVYLVFSNHTEFLHRYLEELRFWKDTHNYRTALDLLKYMAKRDHNDPVEAGIKMACARMGVRLPRNVKFLREDADFKIWGFQLGAHGHNSSADGRGSIVTKEVAYGPSVTGHVHTAEAQRLTFTVGTHLPVVPAMFYMRGQPTKWTMTNAFLWNTGLVQLVHAINGEWRARLSGKRLRKIERKKRKR